MERKTLGENGKSILIKGYFPEKKKTDCAVAVLAGGAYMMRTPHSGEKYAEFLVENGIAAFVADYRIKPFEFPYGPFRLYRGKILGRKNSCHSRRQI